MEDHEDHSHPVAYSPIAYAPGSYHARQVLDEDDILNVYQVAVSDEPLIRYVPGLGKTLHLLPGPQTGIREQDLPVVLDLEDMARLMKLSPHTIRARHKAGRMPPIIPLSGRLTWLRDVVLKWLPNLQSGISASGSLARRVRSTGVSLAVKGRNSP